MVAIFTTLCNFKELAAFSHRVFMPFYDFNNKQQFFP
jgi:hypothetical protein